MRPAERVRRFDGRDVKTVSLEAISPAMLPRRADIVTRSSSAGQPAPVTGSGQSWRAAEYAAHGRFVADLATGVVELLCPQPGERILDIGCGDGALTSRIAATGASLVAVDGSFRRWSQLVAGGSMRGTSV